MLVLMKQVNFIYSLLTVAILLFSVLVAPVMASESVHGCCPPEKQQTAAVVSVAQEMDCHTSSESMKLSQAVDSDGCGNKSCDLLCCGMVISHAVITKITSVAENPRMALSHKLWSNDSVLAFEEQRHTPPPKINIYG